MEAAKKKSILSKLKMPAKKQDPMLEMDDSEMALDAPDAEGQAEGHQPEPSQDDGHPDESPAEESKELHLMPDEELTKELEARGWHCTPPKEGEGSAKEEASESPEEESQEQAPDSGSEY